MEVVVEAGVPNPEPGDGCVKGTVGGKGPQVRSCVTSVASKCGVLYGVSQMSVPVLGASSLEYCQLVSLVSQEGDGRRMGVGLRSRLVGHGVSHHADVRGHPLKVRRKA